MSKVSFGNNEIVIPKGKKGSEYMTVDLSAVYVVESRIPEIQRSTPVTLPELVTVFITGLLQITRIIALVELETKEAKRVLEHTKAVVLLERVEAILKEKSIKSSTDTREAAILLDPEYAEAREKYDILTAIQTFLAGKHNAIENAYHGAKKICDVFIKVPTGTMYGGDGENT